MIIFIVSEYNVKYVAATIIEQGRRKKGFEGILYDESLLIQDIRRDRGR